MKKSIVALLLVSWSVFCYAQIPPEYKSQISVLLADKDITEAELQSKLVEKGVALDNLSPEDTPMLKSVVEEAIKEIEEEKLQNGSGAVVDKKVEFDRGDKEQNKKQGNVSKNDAEIDTVINRQKTTNAKNLIKDIYGHNIFKNQTIEFISANQSSSTSLNYVLDAGDKVAINIFGRSQADLVYEIEPDGFIRPTGLYKIYLKGVPLGKAKELLRQRFKQAYVFQSGQFNIELHTARTITVGVFGEVQNPGSFTVSSLNTVLNVLVKVGGVTSQGSVRKIKIISENGNRFIDLYEFISNPKRSSKLNLRNNDVIYIPPFENLVELKGPFSTTGYFEMIKGETLEDLLKLAGSIRPDINVRTVNVARFGSEGYELNTIGYLQNRQFVLNDKDIITFKTFNKEYENFVAIDGAVRFNGEYQLKTNNSLKEVLENAILEDYARLDIAYLTRKSIDGTFHLLSFVPEDILSSKTKLELNAEDSIQILSQKEFAEQSTFVLDGAVRKPLKDHYVDAQKTIRVSDAILLAGGVLDDATDFGFLTSKVSANSKTRSYTMLNLKQIINNPGGKEDIYISPFDSIYIPSKELYENEYEVSVKGAVRNPGDYIYGDDLTLKDVLVRSGGLKIEAATNKVDIFRLEFEENKPTKTLYKTIEVDRSLNPLSEEDRVQLHPYDVIVVRSVPNFKKIVTVEIKGEVQYPGFYAISEGKDRITDLVEKAGGLTEAANLESAYFVRDEEDIGQIAINFNKALNGNDNHNLSLADGDEIIIGKNIEVVKISLEGTNADEFVNLEYQKNGMLSVPYIGLKRAGYYVRSYTGGFDKDAKPSKTFVKYRNGRIKKTRNFYLFRIQPKVSEGAEIMVSMKPKKKSEDKKKRKDNKDNNSIDVKNTVTELMALLISAFTVVTLATKLQ